MRKTQKFKEMLLTDYGLVDKEDSVDSSHKLDFEDIKVQHVGLGHYQPNTSQVHLHKQQEKIMKGKVNLQGTQVI